MSHLLIRSDDFHSSTDDIYQYTPCSASLSYTIKGCVIMPLKQSKTLNIAHRSCANRNVYSPLFIKPFREEILILELWSSMKKVCNVMWLAATVWEINRFTPRYNKDGDDRGGGFVCYPHYHCSSHHFLKQRNHAQYLLYWSKYWCKKGKGGKKVQLNAILPKTVPPGGLSWIKGI